VDGDDETPRDRLLLAFEMFEFGVEMMAANLRRRHPAASADQIELLLEQWLAKRPGPDLSDGEFAVVQLPMPRQKATWFAYASSATR
jgi:hypothetical protein